MKSIFGIVFGQNLGGLPPGVPIYRVPFNCYAVDYEDIASRFNLNAFLLTLCYLMTQTGRIFAKYQYLGSFLVKIWVFDLQGCPFTGSSPQLFGNY